MLEAKLTNAGQPAKKRGRKKKEESGVTTASTNTNEISHQSVTSLLHTGSTNENITLTIVDEHETATPKKRGRRPKGGKLIVKQQDVSSNSQPLVNVILHLKCSMSDLTNHNTILNKLVTDPMTYNPTIPPTIMTYNTNETTNHFSVYENVDETCKPVNAEIKDIAYADGTTNVTSTNNLCRTCSVKIEEVDDDADISIKDINAKLKSLKIQLYKNNIRDKKSACFWCTYEYDNPSCYIPKYETDEQIYGYGSFCRPECAVAFLMKENIDDSTKFERYHLLNQIYCKVYDYKKNIKPAPNPYYLLEKFYGNLSIQEYRKLLKSEHMLLVIDKPMTRILPELHEDNEEFIMNIYGGKQPQTSQSGVYKVKRESERQKGPTKNSIMKDKFGMA